MTNFETARPLPFGAITTYRIVSFFDTAIENVRNKRATSATTRVLNSLSEHQLEDIGLSRSDIPSAARAAVAGQL